MNRSKWIALTVLALLQVGDWFSTRLALRVPGVVEGSPVVASMGLLPSKALALLICVLIVWRTKKLWHVWALCGIGTLVVGSNLYIALRGGQ